MAGTAMSQYLCYMWEDQPTGLAKILVCGPKLGRLAPHCVPWPDCSPTPLTWSADKQNCQSGLLDGLCW